MVDKKNSLIILKSTLSRLPSYFCYIEEQAALGVEYISATAIAESLSINPVQVRKDLASISSVPGRPRRGFKVDSILIDLKRHLGYDSYDEAVLVGVGALGHVLMQYKGFENYGLGIVAGFDKEVREKTVADKPVYSVSSLLSFLKRTKVKIGIIAVPAFDGYDQRIVFRPVVPQFVGSDKHLHHFAVRPHLSHTEGEEHD